MIKPYFELNRSLSVGLVFGVHYSQADFYLEQLEKAFYSVLDNPYLGKSRDDIKVGYRSLLVEKHLFFYRLVDEQLEIMRILHYRMDIIRHL